MQNWCKKSGILLFFSLFIPTTYAEILNPTFSPYADLTINAHWDSQYQDMEPMDLNAISQSSGIKNYHLAFITDSGSCNPAWGGQSTYSVADGWGQHLTDKLHANGINYTIAFGGASGMDISLACTESQLLDSFEQVVKTYQPNGLDFDIENGTANVPKLMSALKQFQLTHPDIKISFTLPVLPEGLVAEGKSVVNEAKINHLNFSVNIMAMDFGPAYSGDMGQYSIQAATSLYDFLKQLFADKTDNALWNMIEVTPMIGVNDVNTEQFTLTDADALRDFAVQKHLGGISLWSVARDNPCPDQWASPICSGKNLQTKSYEFAQHFLK